MESYISNRELTENGTWIGAITWFECSFCNYLEQNLTLTKVAVSCNRCRKSGRPRTIFPGISSDRLLKMISHFYSSSQDRSDERATILAQVLSEQLDQNFEPAFSVNVALAVQSARSQSMCNDAAFEELLGTIRERFKLHSKEEASKILGVLLGYSDTTEEHQVIALLTASLLEQMFKQLLMRMFVNSGKDWEFSRKAVRARGSQREREKAFSKLAGVRLEEVIPALGFSNFYTDWQKTSELRNKFMHGTPFVIRMQDAEMAFELAKSAFQIFAQLHNRFCLADIH